MAQHSDGGVRRRRGAVLEDAILRAALDELAAVGYQQLTMEGVATRAGTGKQVLYRRWHNRAELVVAAIRHSTGSIAAQIPDTGTLRSDILALLDRMVQRQRDVGPDTVHGLMAEAAELPPEFWTIMSDVMTTLLRRAAGRGECTLAGLSPRVISLPATLLRYEILFSDSPVDDDTLTGIVDDVFLPLVAATADRDTREGRSHETGRPADRRARHPGSAASARNLRRQASDT